MIIHTLAAVSAIALCLRYIFTLSIAIREAPRYFRKSFNLAICYVGFVPTKSYLGAWRAGTAAFLCCAYDIVTDWRGFNEQEVQKFDHLLQRHAPDLRNMALCLLERDRREELIHDGLERGITSAVFITELIGSRAYFEEHVNFNDLGIALQVVDDILDYEADICSRDTNCLVSPLWEEYILLFEKTLPKSEVDRLFPHGYVLKYVIESALKKAQTLKTQLRHHKSTI